MPARVAMSLLKPHVRQRTACAVRNEIEVCESYSFAAGNGSSARREGDAGADSRHGASLCSLSELTAYRRGVPLS